MRASNASGQDSGGNESNLDNAGVHFDWTGRRR
jgi:hypothetical protein